MFSSLFNDNRKKIYNFQNFNLQLFLENGWIEYIDDDKKKYSLPLAFFKETNGVGALQISVLTLENGKIFDIDQILKKNGQSNLKINKYKFKEWIVYECEKSDHNRVFKYSYLVNSNFLVYATYNYNIENFSEKELQEAIKIIKTIEVFLKD